MYIRDATKFDDSNTLELPFKRVLGSYGYQAGGLTTVDTSIITRSDYSNDTNTAITRGNTTYNTQGNSGLSTINFGYSLGTAPISSMDRIDYSNDNTTVGPLWDAVDVSLEKSILSTLVK